MDTKDAGRLGGLKGGLSRSPAKRRAARVNAAKARAAWHARLKSQEPVAPSQPPLLGVADAAETTA
jgi:hypothetical protein